MTFAAKRLESWDQIHQYARHGWVYRGQRQATWGLETSLERFCDRGEIPLGQRRDLESRLCREFRRGYHQYALHVPRNNSMLEWFALMQHHGSPTRMLDFTYSIYVAAYFAIEEADNDCALWAINGVWALQASVALLKRAGKAEAEKLELNWDDGGDTIFDDIVLKEPVALCATPQNPFRLNERLQIGRASCRETV